MARDVFITRAASPAEGAQTPIPERVWHALIRGDRDLEAPDEAYPSFVRWGRSSGAEAPWIDWADGNLFTRNPGEAFLVKLLELAEVLRARVLDEEGGAYRIEAGRVVREPPPVGPPIPAAEEEPTPIRRERRAVERLIAPRLEEILDEVEPEPELEPPPPDEVTGEELFGPRPKNADTTIPGAGSELHAEASFARPPEASIEADPLPMPLLVAADLPFGVGDRVRTQWGRPATVVSIDPEADGGLGEIEIRYDDGRVASMSGVGHGLVPL